MAQQLARQLFVGALVGEVVGRSVRGDAAAARRYKLLIVGRERLHREAPAYIIEHTSHAWDGVLLREIAALASPRRHVQRVLKRDLLALSTKTGPARGLHASPGVRRAVRGLAKRQAKSRRWGTGKEPKVGLRHRATVDNLRASIIEIYFLSHACPRNAPTAASCRKGCTLTAASPRRRHFVLTDPESGSAG